MILKQLKAKQLQASFMDTTAKGTTGAIRFAFQYARKKRKQIPLPLKGKKRERRHVLM